MLIILLQFHLFLVFCKQYRNGVFQARRFQEFWWHCCAASVYNVDLYQNEDLWWNMGFKGWIINCQNARDNERNSPWGFPRGLVVKNPPTNAGGFNPWCRKISHASEKLNPCTNYWACALEPVHHNKSNHCSEKPARCNLEEPLFATTRKEPEQWGPSTAKIKYSF